MRKFLRNFVEDWAEFFKIQSEITIARNRYNEWRQ